MQDYITQTHPDKLELFLLCDKAQVPDTESYWCYFESGKYVEDLYAEEDSAFVAVFKKSQNGYKLADQRVPYPSEDELVEKLGDITYKDGVYLEIKLESLKKSKWEMLMEAYINGN